jgi:hypothetical protein
MLWRDDYGAQGMRTEAFCEALLADWSYDEQR